MNSVRRLTDSVRVRVTVLATFLVAVVMIVGALLLTRAVEDRLVSDREQAATAAVGATVDQVENGVPFGAIVNQTFDQGAGVGIFNDTGAPVGGEFTLPIKTITVVPGTGPPADQVIFVSGVSRRDVAYDAAPVAVAGGNFYVVGMASLAEVRHSVRTLWSGLRLGIPLVVLAVALVAWFLAGRALRPVEAMRLEVENISATTLQRRVREPRSHDEVARLARDDELDARTPAGITRARAPVPVRRITRAAVAASFDARPAGNRFLAESGVGCQGRSDTPRPHRRRLDGSRQGRRGGTSLD